ncbi:unnamed protein product, partial [Urochloa humidicola]
GPRGGRSVGHGGRHQIAERGERAVRRGGRGRGVPADGGHQRRREPGRQQVRRVGSRNGEVEEHPQRVVACLLGVGTPAAAAPPAVLEDGAATLFVTDGAYALVRTFDVLTERRLVDKAEFE